MSKTTCPTCGGTGKVIDREVLRGRRLEAGIKLVEMAKRMGISPSYYSDLEQGRRDWNAGLFEKFDKALR